MIGHAQSTVAMLDALPCHLAEQALVESIAEGDKVAFQLLYLRHRQRVHRFVVRLTANESIAEDVVNEVFLAVWRQAKAFKSKSQVTTWLLGIARFKAISACRRCSGRPRYDHDLETLEDPADGPVLSAENRQRSDILRACLAKLTPTHREVINRFYFQEQEIDDVARWTGAPVSTIKTRLHYARSRMAELLIEAGVDRTWLAI